MTIMGTGNATNKALPLKVLHINKITLQIR